MKTTLKLSEEIRSSRTCTVICIHRRYLPMEKLLKFT